MVIAFDVQMGVPKIPNLTADGRDGFSSRAQHDWCIERYLGGMCEKKRGKALIDKAMYERVLGVLFDENDKKTETPQFRWWVRRTFRKQSDERGSYLINENRPLAVKEQIYDILVYCHAECGHGGRDKTCAVARRFYSWIPKDVVSRFVSVCPGCHARTQKDEKYFSNKGSDGYYPVHEKVRELSIARGHATPANYANTSPYQPLLATGMVKLLKGPEKAPVPVSSSKDMDVPEGSMESQHNRPALADITAAHQNITLASNSMIGVPIVQQQEESSFIVLDQNTEPQRPFEVATLSPVDRPVSTTSELLVAPGQLLLPQPMSNSHPVPQDNIPKVDKASASVQQEIANPALPKQIKSGQPVPRLTKLTKKSKIPKIPKPVRNQQARKTSSKTKSHKKAVVAEESSNTSLSSSTHPDTLPRLQGASSSISTSEDDNTSKSDVSSPTHLYPLLAPQFDYGIQNFGGCMQLNNEQHPSTLSQRPQLALNDSAFPYDNVNVVAMEHVHTPIACVGMMDRAILEDADQSNQPWQSGMRGSDEYLLRDPPYQRGFSPGLQDLTNFQISSMEGTTDSSNSTINHDHDIALQQYAHAVDQHDMDTHPTNHNSMGIDFGYYSSQASNSETQMGRTLVAPSMVWSLSAPNDGSVTEDFSGILATDPHRNFGTDDHHNQFQSVVNPSGNHGSPYVSDYGIDYPHQALEQSKHRPPMLQLPPQQFSLDRQGPYSAPLLGGHFDYSDPRVGNNISINPRSAGLDGHFPHMNGTLYAGQSSIFSVSDDHCH